MSARTSLALAAILTVWVFEAVTLPVSAAQGGAPASPVAREPSRSQPSTAHASTFKQYCLTCHNERVKSGGLVLDVAGLTDVGGDAQTWEKVVRKLRTGAMPPAGVPRPDLATYRSTIDWLQTRLDQAAQNHPNPGRALVRRLNRTEYKNAVTDLLGLDVDIASMLPPDDSAFGFDNVADMLGVSPLLVEQYVTAADRISAMAIGSEPQLTSETYRARQDLSQDRHIEGLPLGTVGGFSALHTFARDGEYEFRIELFRTNLEQIRGMEFPRQLVILVDGRQVFEGTVGGEGDMTRRGSVTDLSDAIDARLRVRAPVTAGQHRIGAAFVQQAGLGTQRLQPFLRSSIDTFEATGVPHIESLTVRGPFEDAGAGNTMSRARIFGCRTERPAGERACAMTILSDLARRAFRRQPTQAEMNRIMALFDTGTREGGFEHGVQMGLRLILASPKFLLRTETAASKPGGPGVVRVSSSDLASRLSFFVWSSGPDDELLRRGESGELHKPEVLEAQVRRMLHDPRAMRFVRNFSGQWLQLRNLRTMVPNSNEFPDFDDNLRQALATETELFFAATIDEDRPILDLLTADFTFLNERLARHYGIRGIYGSHFRRVTMADSARRGILGKGALLTVTSHADRTSPVVRGKWILENLMGTPPTPPPPDVPPLEEVAGGGKPLTVRERMEKHRASPQCAGCHRVMDPLGLALENFDAVGAWRTDEAGRPIDATTQLVDGTAVAGVDGLRQALLARPEVFVGTVIEKLMVYALGRGLEAYDMPAVRRIEREAAATGYRWSSLVLGVVNSLPFQYRVVAPTPSPTRLVASH